MNLLKTTHRATKGAERAGKEREPAEGEGRRKRANREIYSERNPQKEKEVNFEIVANKKENTSKESQAL